MISVSGITGESSSTKSHLISAPVIERTGAPIEEIRNVLGQWMMCVERQDYYIHNVHMSDRCVMVLLKLIIKSLNYYLPSCVFY
jgi:hypothetical protein